MSGKYQWQRFQFLIAFLGLVMPACQNLSMTGQAPDPTQGEVALPACADWDAFLLIDNDGVGIWTVQAFPVFDASGTLEVVGLDDKGRCCVLELYSGKWTPFDVINDRRWLGGLAHGDVDPRIQGKELYAGGQRGNLYQVAAYPQGAMDARLIAHLPGQEIHTILAGELDRSHPGGELLVFTRPGSLYRVTPTGEHGRFETELLQKLQGRIRDAVVLPGAAGALPEIATVSRTGKMELLRITEQGPQWEVVFQTQQGLGRLALGPSGPELPQVLYSTVDDGTILRHERSKEGRWSTRPIFLGPQGPRGIVAGRFHEDADIESVAIFGYSSEVILLTCEGEKWRSEKIFVDPDKGHWLAAADLDSRNVTDEIIGSGFGGRIFMLTRPPGYGMPKVAVESGDSTTASGH